MIRAESIRRIEERIDSCLRTMLAAFKSGDESLAYDCSKEMLGIMSIVADIDLVTTKDSTGRIHFGERKHREVESE